MKEFVSVAGIGDEEPDQVVAVTGLLHGRKAQLLKALHKLPRFADLHIISAWFVEWLGSHLP
jgi:hypothetical protein